MQYSLYGRVREALSNSCTKVIFGAHPAAKAGLATQSSNDGFKLIDHSVTYNSAKWRKLRIAALIPTQSFPVAST